jgi:hypothetical protein
VLNTATSTFEVDANTGAVASGARSPEDAVLARNELDFIRSALAE